MFLNSNLHWKARKTTLKSTNISKLIMSWSFTLTKHVERLLADFLLQQKLPNLHLQQLKPNFIDCFYKCLLQSTCSDFPNKVQCNHLKQTILKRYAQLCLSFPFAVALLPWRGSWYFCCALLLWRLKTAHQDGLNFVPKTCSMDAIKPTWQELIIQQHIVCVI